MPLQLMLTIVQQSCRLQSWLNMSAAIAGKHRTGCYMTKCVTYCQAARWKLVYQRGGAFIKPQMRCFSACSRNWHCLC